MASPFRLPSQCANHTIASSKLKFLEKIGTGAFGTVYRVLHEDWGRPVAFKRLESRFIDPADNQHRNLERDLKYEADIHGQLRHRNVVTMMGIVVEPNNYGIVLEFVTYGSLDNFLRNFKARSVCVSWKLKTNLAHDITCGMSYLHTLTEPVVHGDLKIQNVLVGDLLNAKISDFGLSKWRNYSRTYSTVSGVQGTPTHIPPEYWVNPNLRINDKFDVYSFAILLYEMYAERKPFEDYQLKDMIPAMVKDGQRPVVADISSDVPMCISDLIVACWNQLPERRPLFTALMSDLDLVIRECISTSQLKDIISSVVSDYIQLQPRRPTEHSQKIRRVYEKLCDVIRRVNQILDDLLGKKALTMQEYDQIRSPATLKDVAKNLMDILCNKPTSAYTLFLEALNETSQNHLCRLLEEPDYILDTKHQKTLTENFTYLKAHVTIPGSTLLDILLESKVLNQHEVAVIQTKLTDYDKVDQLLCLMMRTSPEQYQQFLTSLQQSNHEFVCDQLRGGDSTGDIDKEVQEPAGLNLSTGNLDQKPAGPKGEASTGHSDQEHTDLNLNSIEIRRLARLDTGGIVSGVTQLHHRIYIVTFKSNRIIVYDSKTFARLKDITVEYGAMGISQTMNAQDIAACTAHNCLYINDSNNNTVWQLTDMKGGHYLINWISMAMFYRLSVMSDGRVLVTSDKPPTISIYDHDACLQQTIKLPDDMEEPQYAVQTTAGTFIVSHGWINSSLRRVCEVSEAGQIIRAYPSQSGPEGIPLNYPAHVTIDSEGRVYVADFRRSQVLLLDKTLSVCRVLLSDDVYEPYRLFYAADTRRLLVGQSGKPVVDVFELNSSSV